MKKRKAKSHRTEMRAEYDFSDGVRGKYAERFSEGTNIVVLDRDVAEVFKSSAAVNRALRAMKQKANGAPGGKTRSAHSTKRVNRKTVDL